MYLETDRLIVRSIQPSDEKAFVEMASDGSLWEIFGDCSECHMWMGEWITDAMKMEKMNNPFQEYLAFVIVDKDSQEVMGSVGSSFYEDFNEVGVTYFIGAKYRGHGYATEALRALVGYLYTTYEMNRLVATASVQNPASCKTLVTSRKIIPSSGKSGILLTYSSIFFTTYPFLFWLYKIIKNTEILYHI